MTPQRLAEIAAAADRLLRSPDTSLARLANPFLHVINQHPGIIAMYEPLADGPPAAPRAATRILGAVRDAARFARAVTAPRPGNDARHSGRTATDVLIVSHASSTAQLTALEDFYFGPLASRLRERGCRVLTARVNHVPDNGAAARDHEPADATDTVVLPLAAPRAVEARVWRAALRERLALHRAATAAGAPDAAFIRHAALHALAGRTIANLRLHAHVAELCARHLPRVVITTYEGDAVERIIWHAAKGAAPGAVCVGYQHTRLLEHSHALRRAVGVPGLPCDPQLILTTGDAATERLAASPGLAGTRLLTYGSHRRAAGAPPDRQRERPARCLVLPDADAAECETLFGFAVACARRLPHLPFVLRPHPITSVALLQARFAWLRALPRNVEWSARELPEELGLCSSCLYRGSSAVLHAVLAGLKPWYLALPGEMPFDPLYGLAEWRETVTSPDEFAARVPGSDAAEAGPEAARAWAFCDRLMSPVRTAASDALAALVRA